MYCNRCGMQIPPNTDTCQWCGEKMYVEWDAQPNLQYYGTQPDIQQGDYKPKQQINTDMDIPIKKDPFARFAFSFVVFCIVVVAMCISLKLGDIDKEKDNESSHDNDYIMPTVDYTYFQDVIADNTVVTITEDDSEDNTEVGAQENASIFQSTAEIELAQGIEITEAVPHPGIDGECIYVYSANDNLGMLINDSFREMYPELSDKVVYVNLNQVMTGDQYIEVLEDAVNSDQPPSIIAYDAVHINNNKYLSDVLVPLDDIGITDEMMSNQYEFCSSIGEKEEGTIGSTWEVYPGAFIYNSRIAIEVFGTDDPGVIQEKVKDVEAFKKTCEELKAKGYYMLPGGNCLEPVFQGGGIDEATYNELSTYMDDSGYTLGYDMWGIDWSDQMSSSDSKVFGAFGTTWFEKWSIGEEYGERRICRGPFEYTCASTYLTATNLTANEELTAFVIYAITCDEYMLLDQAVINSHIPNNKNVVNLLVEGGNGGIVGGNTGTQDVISAYMNGLE